MKFSKKALFLVTALTSAVLAGCQAQSNVLVFNTPSPTSTFNTNNQTATVSVNTRDLRTSRESLFLHQKWRGDPFNFKP